MGLLDWLIGGRSPKTTAATGARAPREPWTPPMDETFEPGERMLQVTSERDLQPGDVIRVWHDMLHEWTPAWWSEVLRIDGRKIHLLDLKTSKEDSRYLGDTLRNAWKHPAADRVRTLGETAGQAALADLLELERRYKALDLSNTSASEMDSILRTELEWRARNNDRYYELKDEFAIREVAITKVGQELHSRGGMKLMRQVCEDLGSPRNLDMIWNGIGNWRG